MWPKRRVGATIEGTRYHARVRLLRAFAFLLTLVLTGQATFDHCLIDCHADAAGTSAACHDAPAAGDTVSVTGGDDCGHDHSRLWLDEAESPSAAFRPGPVAAVAAVVVVPPPTPIGRVVTIEAVGRDWAAPDLLEFPLRR